MTSAPAEAVPAGGAERPRVEAVDRVPPVDREGREARAVPQERELGLRAGHAGDAAEELRRGAARERVEEDRHVRLGIERREEAALDACAAPVAVVSNEVGHSVVPENALARRFRNAQGALNQRLAARAGLVVLVVAGLPMPLKGALP